MAGFKPVIRTGRVNSSGQARIYIRVSHKRKTRYVPTAWYVDPKYMGSDGIVKSSYNGYAKLNQAIGEVINRYLGVVYSLGAGVELVSMEDLLRRLKLTEGSEVNFVGYCEERIDKLTAAGRIALAGSYSLTLKHMKDYASRDVIDFSSIDNAFLQGLDAWLRKKGCRTNTVSVYMRNIRALFNDAIDDNLVRQDLYPFRRYRIPKESTAKRSLTVADLRRLLAYRYEVPKIEKHHAWALDLFFLSFYMIGANVKDLLFLEKSNVIAGRVYYNRAKTSRLYSVLLTPEASAIISLYSGEKYLLSLIERKRAVSGLRNSMQDLHKDVIGYMNRRLKEVAGFVGVDVPLSSYYARHSWATIAASLDVPRDVISHALGHGTSTVTDIYIDFDLAKVDQANRRVIDAIFSF